jgi:hypothetical protein
MNATKITGIQPLLRAGFAVDLYYIVNSKPQNVKATKKTISSLSCSLQLCQAAIIVYEKKYPNKRGE